MNPLSDLCLKLGLPESTLAKITGSSEKHVAACLMPEPAEPISSFLKLIQALGIRWSLVSAPQTAIWVRTSALESLCKDNNWRRLRGLEAFPDNSFAMRFLLRDLRKKGSSKGKKAIEVGENDYSKPRDDQATYGDMCVYLEANWIPTGGGLRNWRRSSIGSIVTTNLTEKRRNRKPLQTLIGPAFMRQFKRYAIDSLIVEMTPFDAFGMVRYGIDHFEVDGKVWITHKPMASSIRQWTLEAVRDLRWFKTDDWGEGEAPEKPDIPEIEEEIEESETSP